MTFYVTREGRWYALTFPVPPRVQRKLREADAYWWARTLATFERAVRELEREP